MSHLENDIYRILIKNNIEFINECNLNGELGKLRVDFYLPKHNIVIECQGGQHFYSAFDRRNKHRADEIHKMVVARDIRKRKILDDNKIKTIYYCNSNDYNTRYFYDEEFCGMYSKDNLFHLISDIDLVVTPQGVQWN